MIPRAHGCRGSIGATVRYFEREKAPGRGRVADIGFVELPPGVTLDTASQIMAATAREQAKIKELRGISARGRPTNNPYYHFSLSWHPEEHPTRPEVEQVVDGALTSLELEGHQAIWVAHADTEHYHAHVAVSRIAWKTGRTVRMSNDRRKLSAWALAYEKSQGQIRVETRVRREAWRSRGRDLVERQQVARGLGDTIAISHLGPQVAEHRHEFPKAERSRGPGREARTDEDRQEWASHFACQRAQPDAEPDVLRRERVRLSRKQGRRRRRKKLVAQVGDTASRVGRVAKDVAGVAGAGVSIGAVELVGGASRATRVGKELVNVAGHEIVCGASRAARVGKSVAILAGLVTLAGTGKLASGGVLLVCKVLEQRDRAAAKAAAKAEARKQEEAMEIRNAMVSRPFYGKYLEQAPVGLLADLRRLVKGRGSQGTTDASHADTRGQPGGQRVRPRERRRAGCRSVDPGRAGCRSVDPGSARPRAASHAAGVREGGGRGEKDERWPRGSSPLVRGNTDRHGRAHALGLGRGALIADRAQAIERRRQKRQPRTASRSRPRSPGAASRPASAPLRT